ncbi:hypothetical protein GGS26DRAFT_315889 [Hypomontagnella submonticulosa]|nr:hypothetical protein GGS26DRAFT_315889 [Hypomontagnella submonticulosa]
MSANYDNPMTRLLFVILQQKNLKDIDWNKVADDPLLAEKISNGHAARMRYSRFKTALLGHEPTRRNRTGQPRSRVSKLKKDAKAKRDEAVKSELASESLAPQEPSETSAPKIKQESSPYPGFDSRLTPRLTPGFTPGPAPMPAGSTMPNMSGIIHPRFLTPASDTDSFSPGTLRSSPASDIFSPQMSFEYRDSPCPERPDPMLTSAPTLTAFAPNHPFDNYGNGHCDHPQIHPYSPMQMELPSQSIELEEDYVHVKNEEWDTYH